MRHVELESSLHLFQPTLFCNQNFGWHRDFLSAVAESGPNLTLEPAAVLSILSFGWICGDLTLVREVKRRPWLSKIGENGKPILEKIPEHGRIWPDLSKSTEILKNLLCEEAARVCQGRKEIYLLLSGGLDSRIAAGVLANLLREGRITCKPVAVTWGFKDSRDIYYAQMIAKTLGFEWFNIEFGPEIIRKNIKTTAIDLGCLHSPEMLHYMTWFENVSDEALVIAASYGDSIGRAEFGGKHLLELEYFVPSNAVSLMDSKVLGVAYQQVLNELISFRSRKPGDAKHAICENEMQGHRMRGGLSHALGIINKYCTIYQMFTDPNVYGYMWSLHPCFRNDDIYAELLEILDSRIARIPWARTNRALKGKTKGAISGLRRDYHEYTKWVSGDLYNELCRVIDPEWFEATGLFNGEKIEGLNKKVGYQKEFIGRMNSIWLWLAAFRYFIEHLENMGKRIDFGVSSDKKKVSDFQLSHMPNGLARLAQAIASRSIGMKLIFKYFRGILRKIRRYFLKKRALIEYPPEIIKE